MVEVCSEFQRMLRYMKDGFAEDELENTRKVAGYEEIVGTLAAMRMEPEDVKKIG